MTTELYTQLRLALLEPGEEWGGYRRPYTPVNKDNWTWEDAMRSEDTPDIAARCNRRQTSFLVGLGRYAQPRPTAAGRAS